MQWNKNATTYSESKTNTPNQNQPISSIHNLFLRTFHLTIISNRSNTAKTHFSSVNQTLIIPLNPDWSIEILTLVYEIIPHIIASCLFQPIGRIWVNLWIFPKVRGEYKETYLKPPSRSLCCDFSLPLSKAWKTSQASQARLGTLQGINISPW